MQYVNTFCDAQSVAPLTLRDRSVRNALTHIDERLADILTAEGNVGWFIDVAISARDEWAAQEGITIGFCRSYIAGEDCILHLGQELNLSLLRHECVEVLAVVFGVEQGREPEIHNPPL